LCEDRLDRGSCIDGSDLGNSSRLDRSSMLGRSLLDCRLAHGLAAIAAKFVLRPEAKSFKHTSHAK